VSARRTVIAVVVIAALGLAGLLAAAASRQRPTAFSIDVPATDLAPALARGQEACQSPIRASSAFGGVRAWIWPNFIGQTPQLNVTVRDLANDEVLASGRMTAVSPRPALQARNIVGLFPTPVSRTSVLTASIAPGRRVSVCLAAQGPGTATLMGAPPNQLSGALRVAGKPTNLAVALVFLQPHSRSLLSLLPTAFRRAALFRPTWVGAWTFWVSAAALLLAFGLVALAVVQAGRADASAGEHSNIG
jgi:hypothetical protein